MGSVTRAVVAATLMGAMAWSAPAVAAGAKDESKESEPAGGEASKSKPSPQRTKRVVHAIELSTKTGNPFRGRVVLRTLGQPSSPLLSYYVGGKCKKTKLAPSRIALLTKAMEKGWGVEIPAFPIKYGGSVVMCMQSVRIVAD